MNVLFLTLVEFNTLKERNIYTDLLREFVENGHKVYAISPIEKRRQQETHIINEENAQILRLKIGNTQKTNLIEKGLSTVLIEPTYRLAIKKYYRNVHFDLIIYSTPPITLVSAIEYVKKRDDAKTYLLLKDIFPQNAVDMGMLSKVGVKGMLYKHFRKQEKKLYHISDRIGCMSQANVEYVLQHNPEIDACKVEVCPNSIEVIDKSVDDYQRTSIRKRYGIPNNKKVFVYGGNLGKPQGIPFLVECLKKCTGLENVYFLIVGDGTEYQQINQYIAECEPNHVKLMKRLPKEDYDTLVGACDIGLIFLDYQFTIPNYPSRLLAYMQAKLPVLAVTDCCTDIGKTISNGGFGWWCKSNDSNNVYTVIKMISLMNREELVDFQKRAYDYLQRYFSVTTAYQTIIK